MKGSLGGAPEPRSGAPGAVRAGALGAAGAARVAAVAGPAPAELDRLVGHRVQIKLKNRADPVEGILFGADASGTIVLQQAAAQLHGSITGMRRVRLVNAAAVERIEVQGLKVDATEQAPLGTRLPALDQARLRDTETRVQGLLAAALRRSDSGVDAQAEALFAKIFAMLPGTRWEGTSIVVGDMARIEAPYDARNVVAGSRAPGAGAKKAGADAGVGRVRSMVEAFWAKRGAGAAAAGGGGVESR